MGRAATVPLAGALVAAILLAGCLQGLPLFGSPVVYPKITPVPGATMPDPPVYTFPFQDRTVTVGVRPDPSVYAGARAADKSARIFDHSIKEEEWRAGIYRALIGDPAQEQFYEALTGSLRRQRADYGLDDDEYAELLAVFVQSLPYETQNLTSPRFPVETYVDGVGDCDDKSLLLAGLLSHEGYRTALLYFDEERHMAVGVGATTQGFRGTGYAYLETTNVSLVGIVPHELAGGITLSSSPTVIPVGNGSLVYTRCNETAGIWNTLDEAERVLALMEAGLQDRERILREMRGRLDAEKAVLDQALAQGDIAGYNARVPGYNAQVQEYNGARATLLGEVDRFNRLAGLHNYLLTHQYDRKGISAWLLANPVP